MARQLYFGCEPGQDVMDLQDALNAVQAASNQASAHARLPVDGRFDMRVQSRVAEFQKLNGLHADGVVGAATWQALMAALQGIPGLKINRPLGGGGAGTRAVAGKPDPGAAGVGAKGGEGASSGKGEQAGKTGSSGKGGKDPGGEVKTGAPAGGGGGKVGAAGFSAHQLGALARPAGGAWAPVGAASGTGKWGSVGGGKGSGNNGSKGGSTEGSKGADEKSGSGSAGQGAANDSGGAKTWLGKGGGMVAAAFGPAQWAPAFSGRYKPPAGSQDKSGGKGGSSEGSDTSQGKSKGS